MTDKEMPGTAGPNKSSKKKWPWNAEIDPDAGKNGRDPEWPKITIVTPSYNQGEFIEETIRSVLLQNYPNLEYIVIDGGSTDQTVDVIKKYEKWIDYWVSEPDRGQSDAINKGFEIATGTYGNWINSDDLLADGALLEFAKHVTADEKTLYIGTCIQADRHLEFIRTVSSTIRSLEDLVDLENHWEKHSISQQNVLFNIEQFHDVGGLNVDNHYSMDYELWGDLMLNGNRVQTLDFEVGIFRRYEGQKISDKWKAARSLMKSAHKLVLKNSAWSLAKKMRLTLNLLRYRYHFAKRMISLRSRVKNAAMKVLKKPTD